MTVCAIPNCGNRSNNISKCIHGITFHKFPSDPDRKVQWVRSVGRSNWIPTKNSVICSMHFTKDSFYETKNGLRRLFLNAIPTKSLPKWVDQSSLSTSSPDTSRPSSSQSFCSVGSGDITGPSLHISSPTESVAEEESFAPTLGDTPRKKHLKRHCLKLSNTVKRLTFLNDRHKKTVKRLTQRKLRSKKTIKSLKSVITSLQQKTSLQENEISVLSLLSDNLQTCDLIKRQLSKVKGQSLKKMYPPSLRAFALTLHFYSPKAYEYVRQTFDTCLPHVQTLRKWYQSLNGAPGFTAEAFKALKMKADTTPYKIVGNLCLDEMAIRKQIHFDGKDYHGYVDMGTGIEGDCQTVAKEALVMMFTCINGNWKLPVAYFLVDGVTGSQRAELVSQCLEKIHVTGVCVTSLTFDGCPANIAMMKHLGCSVDLNSLRTSFKHPSTAENVSVFLDACHMLKLVRNAFEHCRILIDEDGNVIDWRYLERLNEIQEEENFHLANKLRKQHIHFHNNKMKVKFASQLFSNSVADTLIFCRDNLKLFEFKHVAATVNFIRLMNNLFDVLNSRSMRQFDYKQPINLNNQAKIFDFLDYATSYLIQLKTADNTPIVRSNRKMGFIGFLVCIESAKTLFHTYVQNNQPILRYLPLYKCSQDHIELFFGNIRVHGGCNNNPTAQQFKGIYRKLLVHMELRESFRGNCIPLENISLMNCTSPVERINASSERYRPTEEIYVNEDLPCNLLSNLPSCELSEFSYHVIVYISGYVVRTLLQKIICDPCCSSLQDDDRTLEHSFIISRDKGGLIYPSKDVIKVCSNAEKILKQCLKESGGKVLLPKYKINFMVSKVLESFLTTEIFSSLDTHQYDQFPENCNHVVDLIRAISEKYLTVRIHFLTKQFNITEGKRQVFTKFILFRGE